MLAQRRLAKLKQGEEGIHMGIHIENYMGVIGTNFLENLHL